MKLSVVRGEDLAVVRGGREVFRGLSFKAEAGRPLVVVGPNGAGKSTLLRAIAGLVQPTAGQITFEGADAEAIPGTLMHYVGHLDAVKPQLSVTENIGFWAAWLGAGRDGETLTKALASVALDHLADLPAAVLSAGQRRRLSLARLALGERPVWILDEPTIALDAAARERLARLVDAHAAAGGIVIAATHEALGLTATIRRSIEDMCAGTDEPGDREGFADARPADPTSDTAALERTR